jgi:hypothetical protein
MAFRIPIRSFVLVSTWGAVAAAQTPTPTSETGQAPAEATALVTQQAEDKGPETPKAHDGTSITLSAGGQAATGNAQVLAA